MRDSAATIKEKVGPTAVQAREQASHAADTAREWATPRVGAAREWASPRIEKARDRGVGAAAPKVEAAAEALAPKVDAARDKIVEDLLPRLVEAMTVAAAAAAAKTEAAHDRGLSALDDASHLGKRKRRGGKGRVFLLLTVLAGAAAAGWAAWKRSQPTDDPWATGTGTSPSFTSTGDRLSGGEAPGGLGTGTLASESTDVDTPAPDGSTAGETPATGETPGAETSGAGETPEGGEQSSGSGSGGKHAR